MSDTIIKERPDVLNDFKEDAGLDEPPLYRVVLLNDDATSMDFVVDILLTVFHKSQDEAVNIMKKTHETGIGICGVYPHDIAQTYTVRVQKISRNAGFPLRCIMEQT